MLPRVHVADVDFDKRQVDCKHGVADSEARVCECARVYQQKRDVLWRGFMYTIDKFRLRITLMAVQLVTQVPGAANQRFFDVSERGRPIDAGFPRA